MLRWLRKRPSVSLRGEQLRCSLQSTLGVASNYGRSCRHERWQSTGTASRTRETSPTDVQSSSTTAQRERAIRSRHLFRAILRECTYLPDSFAREWMVKHAFTRFRTYDFKAWKKHQPKSGAAGEGSEAVVDYEARLQAKEKEARSWLAYLRRANGGERKCLMRLLFMAYGRIGKRRHELMIPILPKRGKEEVEKLMEQGKDGNEAVEFDEGTGGVAEDEDMSNAPTPAKKKLDLSATIKLEPDLTPPLRALLLSQIQSSPPTLTRNNPRRLTQDIPALNSWLRPMPQKRIKNKRSDHYADLLDRVLPPVPTREWLDLRDLASGKTPIEPPKSRRKPADTNAITAGTGSAALETVLAYGKPPTKVFDHRNAHSMTPRFMRRLYAQVFSQCPLMEWDSTTEKWSVIWGEQALQQGLTPATPVEQESSLVRQL